MTGLTTDGFSTVVSTTCSIDVAVGSVVVGSRVGSVAGVAAGTIRLGGSLVIRSMAKAEPPTSTMLAAATATQRGR